MTVWAKARIVHTKTEFSFIVTAYRHTQYLSIPSVSGVKCQLVCLSEGHFADPSKLQLEQWHPWRMPIGKWGPVFAPTDYVAHWCVISHCVGNMAAHEVLLNRGFYHLPPYQPHPVTTKYFTAQHTGIIQSWGWVFVT